jgi:hypothetical protein
MNIKLFFLVLLMLPVSSIADVWCKAGNGTIYARAVCKKSERQLDLAALGLQGPQGIQGAQGIPGSDAVVKAGCPATIDGKYSGTATRIANFQGQQATIFQVVTST